MVVVVVVVVAAKKAAAAEVCFLQMCNKKDGVEQSKVVSYITRWHAQWMRDACFVEGVQHSMQLHGICTTYHAAE